MWKKLAASLALALLLSGCWHVPMSALWRLRQVDPLAVDPAAIRLAARVPDWMDAPPGHVHLKVISHKGEADEQERLLDLVREDAAPDLRGLAVEAMAGTYFGVFRASAGDAAWLRDVQERARAQKAAGEHHKGSFLITAEPCRRAEPPPGPARVDLYIKLGEKEDFFKVYDDIDPRDPALFPEKPFEEAIPPCGKIAKRAM